MQNLPPLKQTTPKSRPYRLYTIEHLPFDHWGEGETRPRTVVTDGWGKSTTGYDRLFGAILGAEVPERPDEVTLNVYRVPFSPDDERHPLDKTVWPTKRDADRAAYEAGITAFMVYEDQRERLGLPAVQGA